MKNSNWPFADLPNVAVLTTLNIVKNGAPIVYVTYDEEDGMWQFHDGSNVMLQDAMLISLEEAVAIDSSIYELADLPIGWIAWRDGMGKSWRREKSVPKTIGDT